MKKILTLCLSVILLLSLLPSAALAVETFTTSDEGIALIKEYEGYEEMPYTDDLGKWYVGYGSTCDPADYPYGVTEEEADALLREELVGKEDMVNRLLMDHGISVEQHQFDAMVSMSYTLGGQWINPTYRFCSYLINGIWNYSEAEIVNAIATWCHQGTRVLDQLAERRLREAYLFLYGEYDNNGPEEYAYIHFDPAGGDIENKTVFFPVGESYGLLPEPTWTGHRFVAWYTEDGERLTGEELALEDINVTARWDGEATGTTDKELDLSKWVNPYSDVKEKDWFYPYVRELSAKNIMNGYGDGTFQGEKTLTAGEGLKLILLAAGYPEQNPINKHWASGYQVLAEELGCVSREEIPDLDGSITREQVARVAAVAMGLEPRAGRTPFADIDDGYLLALYEERILNGTVEGRERFYYPAESINRAEVSAIVVRIGNWEHKEPNDPAQSGYIEYRDKKVPVLWSVPTAPYDKNQFVQNGSIMYYNDDAYVPSIGIDVSSHQGEIDWNKVAGAGVEFAMIRLGYRGYGQEGTVNLDKYFRQNLEGAKEAGLKVGVYFFSQAISTEEAVEEANFVLENLAEVGVPLDYPVVYDWEPISGAKARTDGLDVETLTDCALAFCETVEQEWYTAMIYYNSPVAYLRYDLSRLTDYDVWYAQYGVSRPTMYYDYRIWQYSDSGKIPGIEGKVDMDIALIPYVG